MKHSDFFERKRHGNPDFPIQHYFVDSKHPQYVMPAHWHKEFEIIHVIKGEFRVFLNNVEYLLEKGDILFVECGCLHRGEPENSIYECIVFDPAMLCRKQNDVISKLMSSLIDSSASIENRLNQYDNDIKQTVFALFKTLRRKREYYELETYSLLFKLFSRLYSRHITVSHTNSQQNNKAETIIRLLSWIEKNITETITLDMLSDISGLNKKYLCRIFKEYTSKTIINYINELRIENACYEISENRKSITQAAFDCGFNDLSYFCKIFKKYKGITPREYNKGTFHS